MPKKKIHPKVSVILTSYNHEYYLKESIDSALNQTFTDFDLILWDDGSTDNSWRIIESYSDEKIRAYKNESNKRGSPIRRIVSELSISNYIAIHHSDDIWESEKLEKQVAYLDAHPEVGAVFTWAKIIDEKGDPFEDKNHFYYKIFEQPNRTRHEWLNYFFYQGNALCHPSVLIRKACYEDVGLYPYGMAQIPDFDMWVRLAMKYEIHVLPEKLVQFRIHSNEANSSGNRLDSRIRSQFEYWQLLNNYRKITDFDDLCKIFPDAKKYARNGREDIEFVLGKIATDTGPHTFTKLFGLNLLFEALNDKNRAKNIKDIYNFTHLDFIELTAKYDVFSVEVINNLNAQLAERDAQLAERDAQLAERDAQLAERNAQLAERDAQLYAIKISKTWRMMMALGRARLFLAPPGSFRAKIVRKITFFVFYLLEIRSKGKIKRNLQLLQESSFFDTDWYLSQNPDVAEEGIDATEHYLLYGGFEGRDPSVYFSSQWYLVNYPDVVNAKVNPLIHYLKYGSNERRILEENTDKGTPLVYEGEINVNKNILYYIKRALFIVKQEGIHAIPEKVLSKYQTVREKFAEEEQIFPKVSIIIPVYNALSMTKACLASVYRETKNIDFEIILIDNASKDGTEQWLRENQQEYANLKVYRMKENIGFGPAVNKGFQYSKGEFVVILNNDTLVSRGWLDNLLSAMEADNTIGIISPVTNYVGEGPQIDKDAQKLPPDINLIGQYAESIVERDDILYEPNRLVFFCVLLKRELIDAIGYLDEGYQKGNFEDDDYCLRARMAGYRLAIAKNAFVYHHGTVTFKENKISHSQWMETNRRYFYGKAGRIATTLKPMGYSARTQEKRLSVIVRTKDRPQLLKKALTSLANQTYRDFEIVLVNDGGKDVSSLLASYEVYFPINYVYHDVSLGRTAAINAGLREAQGKWVAYLDDDDILYSWHFESLLQQAKAGLSKVLYSDCNRSLFANSSSLYPFQLVGIPPWEYNRQELLVQNYLPIHSYIHLRECVEEAGFWDESLDRLEDYDFLIRLSAFCDFTRVPKVTCEYRFYLNDVNSISNGRKEYLDALQRIYKKYPGNNSELSEGRQKVINALRLQSQKIDELLENVGDTDADKALVQREIIRLATGM